MSRRVAERAVGRELRAGDTPERRERRLKAILGAMLAPNAERATNRRLLLALPPAARGLTFGDAIAFEQLGLRVLEMRRGGPVGA